MLLPDISHLSLVRQRRSRRVLITCHPLQPKTDGVFWHFLQDVFSSESSKTWHGDVIEYETVDKLPGGTHEADALSNSLWVKKHVGQFDAVWLPDCGGSWWHIMQLSDISEDLYLEHLERMILIVLSLVKPGGKMYLGKLPEDSYLFASRLLSMSLPAYLDKVKTVTVLDHKDTDYLADFIVLEKST